MIIKQSAPASWYDSEMQNTTIGSLPWHELQNVTFFPYGVWAQNLDVSALAAFAAPLRVLQVQRGPMNSVSIQAGRDVTIAGPVARGGFGGRGLAGYAGSRFCSPGLAAAFADRRRRYHPGPRHFGKAAA